jgi:polyphosphate kinase
MTRNLDHRIEVACPIYDDKLKRELRTLLEIQLSDNVKARILDENQENRYILNDAPPVHSQMTLYKYFYEK